MGVKTELGRSDQALETTESQVEELRSDTVGNTEP